MFLRCASLARYSSVGVIHGQDSRLLPKDSSHAKARETSSGRSHPTQNIDECLTYELIPSENEGSHMSIKVAAL
jgi:hypothetical protein